MKILSKINLILSLIVSLLIEKQILIQLEGCSIFKIIYASLFPILFFLLIAYAIVVSNKLSSKKG